MIAQGPVQISQVVRNAVQFNAAEVSGILDEIAQRIHRFGNNDRT